MILALLSNSENFMFEVNTKDLKLKTSEEKWARLFNMEKKKVGNFVTMWLLGCSSMTYKKLPMAIDIMIQLVKWLLYPQVTGLTGLTAVNFGLI